MGPFRHAPPPAGCAFRARRPSDPRLAVRAEGPAGRSSAATERAHGAAPTAVPAPRQTLRDRDVGVRRPFAAAPVRRPAGANAAFGAASGSEREDDPSAGEAPIASGAPGPAAAPAAPPAP
jgi:hypothetical protein